MIVRPTPFRRLMAAAFILPLILSACGPQAAAPAKPAAEPTKPAAAAPAAPAPAAPAAAPAAPAAASAASPVAAPAAQPTAVSASLKAPADKKNLVVVTGQDVTTF